jgi:trans-aconitate methyltransferase
MKRVKSDLSTGKEHVTSSCWDGKHYSSNSEWQFRVASVALNYMQIPTKAKILDIGCGDGRFTKHLAGLFPNSKILGLDPSSSMLATAQANVMPNLSFIVGDAVRLPIKSQFDRIVAFNSLHWVSEIHLALEQIRNALVLGGQVLILVAPIQVRHPIHRIIDEVAKRKHWSSYFGNAPSVFSFYTPAEWATLIEEAKLIPECLQLIDASFDYPSKKSFADFVAGWIPFGTIPGHKRREYVRDVVEAYVAVTPCDLGGIVHYYMDELVIVASRSKGD